MNKWHYGTLVKFIALLAIGLLCSSHSSATILELHMSGIFSGESGIDGTPFGTPRNFTLLAQFDSSNPTILPNSRALFATNAEFTILGVGSVTTAAGNTAVFLADTLYNGNYWIGLSQPDGGNGFRGIFGDATPIVNSSSPIPTDFSQLISSTDGNMVFNLTNGHQFIFTGVNSIQSASISDVPEPQSLMLVGIFICAILLVRRVTSLKAV